MRGKFIQALDHAFSSCLTDQLTVLFQEGASLTVQWALSLQPDLKANLRLPQRLHPRKLRPQPLLQARSLLCLLITMECTQLSLQKKCPL